MRTSTLALLSGIALAKAEFLAPASGETLQVDEEFTVQWETEGLVEPLNISLVPVGGQGGAGAAQEVASDIDNSGSVSFTPGVQAGEFELVLTDSEENTITSDAFSVGGGEGEADSPLGEGVEKNESAEDTALQVDGQDEDLASNVEVDEVPSDTSSPIQGGRVSAAVEPPVLGEEVETAEGQGTLGSIGAVGDGIDDINNGASGEIGDDNGANAGAGAIDGGAADGAVVNAPGSFIPLSGDQLTIFPTIGNSPAATEGVQAPEVVSDVVVQPTPDVNIQTVPNVLDPAPTELAPLPPPSVALEAPTSVAIIEPVVTSAPVFGLDSTSLVGLDTVAATDALGVPPIPSVEAPAGGLVIVSSPGADVTTAVVDQIGVISSDAAGAVVPSDVSAPGAIGNDASLDPVATDLAVAPADPVETTAGAVPSLDNELPETGSNVDLPITPTIPIGGGDQATDISDPSATGGTSGAGTDIDLPITPTISIGDGSQVTDIEDPLATGDVPGPVIPSDGVDGDLDTSLPTPGLPSDGVDGDLDTSLPTPGLPTDLGGSTTFATNVIGTGIITDGASVTVSQTGADALEATDDADSGSAGTAASRGVIFGLAVLVGAWIF